MQAVRSGHGRTASTSCYSPLSSLSALSLSFGEPKQFSLFRYLIGVIANVGFFSGKFSPDAFRLNIHASYISKGLRDATSPFIDSVIRQPNFSFGNCSMT
jgi:hypothetical protein